MKTIYSPANIEILLHCHASPHPHPKYDSQGFRETINTFLEMGVVEIDGERIMRTTALGNAWVRALCNTPPPRPAFIDEMGRVV